MSTTASSQSPSIVRSQSTSKQQPTYPPPDPNSPSRTRSAAARPTSANQRTPSGTGMYRADRTQGPPSAAMQGALANVARRDVEDASLPQSPPSRRSTSKDRYHEARPQTYRTESSGSQGHRTSSRHGSRRPSTDLAPVQTVATNGTGAEQAASERPTSSSQQATRRRTTITTQTGTWLLGKTIGQGSMGKVKLGKNLETGEQVSREQQAPVRSTTNSR